MRTKDQEDYENFKALGHLGQSSIKEAKRDFINEKLQINKEDLKSLWKVLNMFQSIGKIKFTVSKLGLDIDGEI